MTAQTSRPKKKRFTLSTYILLGVVLGILCGILFGEYCAPLEVIGNAFIGLLQMTILPYIIVSLILAIGSLRYDQAGLLAVKAGILQLLFWAIAFAMILLMPLSFPKWQSASFFSTSMVKPPPEIDYLHLYIPSNPFNAMANNIVPAVVLFSLMLGIAIIGIKKKDVFLSTLSTASEALMKVTGMVVKLTPIGVFAISANAAGTMSVAEFGRLQVYLVSYNAAALLLTFFILPMLLKPCTPFKFSDIMRLSRDALLTAFTTGNLFVVLPVLTENCKTLFREYDLEREDTDVYIDVMIPVSFNFPNTGKLIMLLFIPFAGWFTGSGMPLSQYPTFVVSGLLSFFGGVDVALPFMLNLLHLPADMYQLYVVTGVINGRTSTLLAAMHLLVFTLLTTSAMTATGRCYLKKAIRVGLICVAAILATILLCRVYFDFAVENKYDRDKVLARMHVLDVPLKAKVYKRAEKLPPAPGKPSTLAQIKKRGFLYVGYSEDALPFTFFNQAGELVGYDVDMAYELRQDLGIDIVFIPYRYDKLVEMIKKGQIDVAMGGLAMTPSRFDHISFTNPSLELTYSLVVPDYRKQEFTELEKMRQRDDLTIAVLNDEYMIKRIKTALPKATIEPISSYLQFFEGNIGTWDALAISAEAGSAWTLLYPKYGVVIPKPRISTYPAGYGVAMGNQNLRIYLNNWLTVMKNSNRAREAYNRWILGKGAEEKKPRWSVIRNVLHLVK
jgi:Na+/H+-dicarboxylate symporter